MQKVVRVELHLNRYGQFVAAVDLGPAGQAGGQTVDALSSSQGDQILLIEQGRTRANNAHISSEDTPKLGQFVEA